MKQELYSKRPSRAMPPRHFADLDPLRAPGPSPNSGLPAFRANQLYTQYYGRLTGDPRQMTDLPAAVREQVADALFPDLLTAARQIQCDRGETRKTLWRAGDGTTFESVLMRYRTVRRCISSQAGCGMACPFCATGRGGLTRNLSTAEIVEQVRYRCRGDARRILGTPVPNRVHGHGEPLANYNRVIAAVRRIVEAPPDGFGISARSVTVSTVGSPRRSAGSPTRAWGDAGAVAARAR